MSLQGALLAASAQQGAVFDPASWGSPIIVSWAEDPRWQPPADGAAVTRWHNGGSLRTSGTTYTHTDTSGMWVPGTTTYAGRMEHVSAYNITDLDCIVQLQLADWTPATVARGIIEKRVSNNETTTLSWEVAVRTDGTLQIVWITTGGTQISVASTAATGVTDNTAKWLRFVLDVDNGAGGYDVKFYTGDDGATWTQLGSTVTGGSTTDIRTNTSPFSFGVAGVSNDAVGIGGYFKRAILRDGIDGSPVFDIDFQRADTGYFVEAEGNAVFVEANVDLFQTSSTRRPLYRAAVAALNGKPALDGDGSNDFLGTVGFTGVAQPLSVLAILEGAASGKAALALRGGAGSWAFYWNPGTTAWWAHLGAVLQASSSTADANPHLMRFYANGASSVIAEDETGVASGSGGTAAMDAFGVFDIGATNFPWGGHIAFAAVYSGDVTAKPGWGAFKAWARDHYGLTIA